ncbi:MAG: DinB family protein [Acetobacteraceae bacterium]|nr:DinB family protein [Acetobacteraceae bacterium]
MPSDDKLLRDHLLELLKGASAHVDFSSALADFPEAFRAAKPHGAPHSAWQLLEHTRIALHDLLEFCANSHYLPPKWPDDYWPPHEGPSTTGAWNESVAAARADFDEFIKLVEDPATNLYATIPWGEGQTILREVLLAADHTSYHLGQIVFLRKQLDAMQS